MSDNTRARRVLAIVAHAHDLDRVDALRGNAGMLILMASDPVVAGAARSRFHSGAGTTIIGGDPQRMLYKLSGPFDLIICAGSHASLRPALERLLAADGRLIVE